ncbi:MAG: hypothetical protein ACI8TX_002466 [Hyphomicrobiaceae bacterium]|jgi:hypothetical protein
MARSAPASAVVAEGKAGATERAAVPEGATDPEPRVVAAKPSRISVTAPRQRQVVDPTRDASKSDEPAPAREVSDGVDAGAYIAALRAKGETRGLAAFNPPGTKPLLAGVVVPESYELPEGYVRHFQNTDDGRQLEAILTLSPDYELLDSDGQPIDLGPDRLVPLDHLPPNLAPDLLDIESGSGQALR